MPIQVKKSRWTEKIGIWRVFSSMFQYSLQIGKSLTYRVDVCNQHCRKNSWLLAVLKKIQCPNAVNGKYLITGMPDFPKNGGYHKFMLLKFGMNSWFGLICSLDTCCKYLSFQMIKVRFDFKVLIVKTADIPWLRVLNNHVVVFLHIYRHNMTCWVILH